MITRRAIMLGLSISAASVPTLQAAEIDGQWRAEFESPRGLQTVLLELKADGGTLTGTVGTDAAGTNPIRDGRVEGDQVTFGQVMARGDFEMHFKYEGKLMGDELELTRTMARPPGGGPGRAGPDNPGGGPGRRAGGGPEAGQPRPGRGRPRGNMRGAVTFTAKRVR